MHSKLVSDFGGNEELWREWRSKFSALMAVLGLQNVMRTDAVRPAADEAEARALWDKNCVALHHRLVLFTSGTALSTVMEFSTDFNGAAAWKALVERYEKKGYASMSALHEELINMPMPGDKDPTDYFLKLEDLQTKLKDQGVTVEDATLKGIATARMPPNYEVLQTVVDSKPDLTYAALKKEVKTYYDRHVAPKQKQAPGAEGVALMSQHKKRGGASAVARGATTAMSAQTTSALTAGREAISATTAGSLRGTAGRRRSPGATRRRPMSPSESAEVDVAHVYVFDFMGQQAMGHWV